MVTTELDTAQISHAVCGRVIRLRNSSKCTECSKSSEQTSSGSYHGTPAQQIDRVGRQIISAAGYGDFFVHRTGHGIGVEAHEEPYIVEGNTDPIQSGNVFSIEPGYIFPNKWGIRLEDIVAVTKSGPLPLNTVNRSRYLLARND